MTATTSELFPAGNAAFSADAAWLQSVQQFFSRFNWDDQPPEVQKFQSAALLDPAGSLLLTVDQFFSTIPWEGNSLLFGEQHASFDPDASLTAEVLTLDDFSSLF